MMCGANNQKNQTGTCEQDQERNPNGGSGILLKLEMQILFRVFMKFRA